MPSIAAKVGKGAQVRIGRGATPTWTVLAGLEDVSMPNKPATEIDVTNQQSPGRFEESFAGLIPSASVSLTGFYVEGNATDVLLLDLYETGEEISVEMTAVGGAARVWRGWVKAYTPAMPVKGAMKFSVEIQINNETTA
jgi:predicted secreted protein